MKQATCLLPIQSPGRGLLDITPRIADWVAAQSLRAGLLTVFCRHTSASLLIQESADPAVRRDLLAYFDKLAPEGAELYEHGEEGLDDMPAHLRTALTQVQISIPLIEGRLALGTWQAIYLFEHRRRAQERQLALHLLGE